jgi:hypothetical protein
LLAFGFEHLGESSDKGRGQRAFGKKVAQQVRDAKRGEKGVIGVAGTEENGKNLVAHQAENPADHHGQAYNPRVARHARTSALDILRLSVGSFHDSNSYPVARNATRVD